MTGKTVEGSMLALYFGMFYELEGDISMSYRTKIYLKGTLKKKRVKTFKINLFSWIKQYYKEIMNET